MQNKNIKRRKFLKDTFTKLPLVLLTPSLLAACGEDDAPIDKSVLIIGAGIAGLAAAKQLKAKGFAVTVLESQEKVGGRLRTTRTPDVVFDEGASWIHGPTRNPITDLAKQAGANTFLTSDDNIAVYDTNGTAYPNGFLYNQEQAYENALNAVRKGGKIGSSFQTIFNSLYPATINDRLWKYMLSAFLEFDTGGDIDDLSSLYFDDDENFSGEDVIITDGYDKITDFLAQGLDIKLNTRVTAINYGGADKATVTANSITYRADYVLLTVPLGVLKKNVIAFTPELNSDKRQAIANVGMGVINKFVLVWNTPFWDTNLQYIGYTSDIKGKL
jgi:monoamine oxidase